MVERSPRVRTSQSGDIYWHQRLRLGFFPTDQFIGTRAVPWELVEGTLQIECTTVVEGEFVRDHATYSDDDKGQAFTTVADSIKETGTLLVIPNSCTPEELAAIHTGAAVMAFMLSDLERK